MKDMHYFAYFKQKKTLKNQTLKELANLAPKNWLSVYEYTNFDM